MNVDVYITDETKTITTKQQEIAITLIKRAIEKENVEGDIEVSVTFVNESRIQSINKMYRNIDEPTDVISFALNDGAEEELDSISDEIPNALGDIIISVPHIQKQADAYGHSFERELGFLLVHGTLHLLGYTHDTKEKEKEMFQKQENILTHYGLTR